MRLVDSHAHLDAPQFRRDLPEVIERARRAGVETILTVGCLGPDGETADNVLRILDSFPGTFASFGVHPHDARFMSDRVEEAMTELLKHPDVPAVGEIGLDYHYDNSPRDVQREVFRRQIRMANALGKPIIVHSRDAEGDTLRLLKEESDSSGSEARGVLHCFSGTPDFAEAGVSLGFHVSFGGILTFKNSEAVRAAMDRVPDGRLLLETDSPYLAPAPMRGKRNEPAFVGYVAAEMARRRGWDASRVAAVTRDNFAALFRLEGHRRWREDEPS